MDYCTSRSDLPGALCTRMFPAPSLGMVNFSRLHSIVAGGLDITSQLMLTGFPSQEKNIVWLVWNFGASVKEWVKCSVMARRALLTVIHQKLIQVSCPKSKLNSSMYQAGRSFHIRVNQTLYHGVLFHPGKMGS